MAYESKAPWWLLFKNGCQLGLESSQSAATLPSPFESFLSSGKSMAAPLNTQMIKASTSSSTRFEKAPCKERSVRILAAFQMYCRFRRQMASAWVKSILVVHEARSEKTLLGGLKLHEGQRNGLNNMSIITGPPCPCSSKKHLRLWKEFGPGNTALSPSSSWFGRWRLWRGRMGVTRFSVSKRRSVGNPRLFGPETNYSLRHLGRNMQSGGLCAIVSCLWDRIWKSFIIKLCAVNWKGMSRNIAIVYSRKSWQSKP